MTHLEIYTFIRHQARKLDLSFNVIALHLSEVLGKEITPQNVQGFIFSEQPPNRVAVKALSDAGFNQMEIAQQLGISQPTVSLHARSTVPIGYKNAYWAVHVDGEKIPQRDDLNWRKVGNHYVAEDYS